MSENLADITGRVSTPTLTLAELRAYAAAHPRHPFDLTSKRL